MRSSETGAPLTPPFEPLPRIHTFSIHCRQRYGQAVGKIPLDLGIPCPNRAKGGCLFCQPASFTPYALRTTDSLYEQVQRGKRFLLRNRFRRYFAYLQQETPTAMPIRELVALVEPLLADADCVGLIISTRPDAIAEDLPGALAHLAIRTGKDCLVELGLQSIHASSLTRLNRNHSCADFVDAAARILDAGQLQLGAHILLGIPGESIPDMLATVRFACSAGVSALKLHHLQVLRGTALALLHARGQVPVFSVEEYLELLLHLLPLIPQEVVIHRLWATSHPHLLIAPAWQRHTGELSQTLQQMMHERDLRQGQQVALSAQQRGEEPEGVGAA